METMLVKLDEDSLQRLGDIVAQKILFAKNAPEPWVDIKKVSAHLNKSVNTIYQWVHRDGLPCDGGNPLRFKLTDVDTWLRGRK